MRRTDAFHVVKLRGFLHQLFLVELLSYCSGAIGKNKHITNITEFHCRATWIVAAAAYRQHTIGPPDRTYVIHHHKMDQLLMKQCCMSDCQAASPIKLVICSPSLSCLFFPAWLMFAGEVSCISRVMPKYHTLSASYIDSGWAFGCIL